MTTCYLVRDINGNPAHDTPVTVDYAGRRIQARTNAYGIVKFNEDIPSSAKVYTVGDATIQKVQCDQGTQPGDGETTRFKVGMRCTVVNKVISGRLWSNVRHDSRGLLDQWQDDEVGLIKKYSADKRCYEAPEPETQTTDVLGLVDSVKQRLDALYDKFAGLEAWLIERIVNILLAGLDREVEKRGR